MRRLRVFLTVGTHEQPFERLIRMAERASASVEGTEWAIQAGPVARLNPWPSACVLYEDYMGYDGIQEWNAWADVVVSHSSPGSVFGALSGGADACVVPRLHRFAEHVNDHQLTFASRLNELGLATFARETSDLVNLLNEVMGEPAPRRIERIERIVAASEKRSELFVAGFGRAVGNLVSSAR